ncbi:cytochrome P450 [Streptomyces sp. NPDC007100]|uniref:cytochrome P450 family protein n=1 Tax=Streptomyces sp. NPDC007100 TaxID=3155602 RepID=UPI0033FF5640
MSASHAPLSRPPMVDEPHFSADPYPTYAWLREHSPVRRIPLSRGGHGWLLTRYADVVAALSDARMSKNNRHISQRVSDPYAESRMSTHMLSLDPPDHTRLRRLVASAFTPRRMEQMRVQVVAIARELAGGLPVAAPVDLISRYALPLPFRVICELLGVTGLIEREEFHSCVLKVFAAPAGTPAHGITGHVSRLEEFFTDLIEAKRTRPGDDLLSALIAAHEAGVESLTDDELLSMTVLLLIAGYANTVNLIGNGAHLLLRFPHIADELRADHDLLPQTVEEILRYESPIERVPTLVTREPVTYSGVDIGPGEVIYACVASANRDPERFADPDRFDPHRADIGHHLGFGKGIHYCLGAALARIEGEVALTQLLDSFGHMTQAVPEEELNWRSTFLFRSLAELPVTLTPSRAPAGAGPGTHSGP